MFLTPGFGFESLQWVIGVLLMRYWSGEYRKALLSLNKIVFTRSFPHTLQLYSGLTQLTRLETTSSADATPPPLFITPATLLNDFENKFRTPLPPSPFPFFSQNILPAVMNLWTHLVNHKKKKQAYGLRIHLSCHFSV